MIGAAHRAKMGVPHPLSGLAPDTNPIPVHPVWILIAGPGTAAPKCHRSRGQATITDRALDATGSEQTSTRAFIFGPPTMSVRASRSKETLQNSGLPIDLDVILFLIEFPSIQPLAFV